RASAARITAVPAINAGSDYGKFLTLMVKNVRRQISPRITLISRIKLFAADERRDTRIYREFVIPSAARNPLWFLITQTKKHRGKRKTILANGEAPKGRRICSPGRKSWVSKIVRPFHSAEGPSAAKRSAQKIFAARNFN